MMHLALLAARYLTVLGWMTILAPGRDHSALAWAIAGEAVDIEEAATFTAVAFRESSFRNDAIGDGGRSVCAMQVLHGSRALLEDPHACVRRGAKMLRASRRIDPAHPIAAYARGPRWHSLEAQRISNDRMALAQSLLLLTRDESQREREARLFGTAD